MDDEVFNSLKLPGPCTSQFAEIVVWLTNQIKSFVGLEEHVNSIASMLHTLFKCINTKLIHDKLIAYTWQISICQKKSNESTIFFHNTANKD